MSTGTPSPAARPRRWSFAQVEIDRAVVGYGGNCGNISSGVGPFAIDEGLIEPTEPITKVGNLVVAYGLGNFLSNQHLASCCPVESQDGMIAHFTFTEIAPESGEYSVSDIAYTATRVDLDTYSIVPVNTALADPALAEDQREILDESRRRTDEAVGLLGLLAHPSGM